MRDGHDEVANDDHAAVGARTAMAVLVAAVTLGVVMYVVFFGGDDDDDIGSATGAESVGVAGDDQEMIEELRQRIVELEERASAAEAALIDATTTTSPAVDPASIDVVDTIDATLPAVYRITWGDPTACQGLDPCEGIGGPMDDFYIDTDPETGQFRLVAPDIIEISLEREGSNLIGTAVAVDSKWECPTDGLTARGTMSILLSPGSFDLVEGGAVVGSLVGDVELAVEGTQCPALYFGWSITARRV